MFDVDDNLIEFFLEAPIIVSVFSHLIGIVPSLHHLYFLSSLKQEHQNKLKMSESLECPPPL